MIKRLISFLLIAALILPCMSAPVLAADQETYGYFDVMYMEENSQEKLEAMQIGSHIYIEASFYERYGFEVLELTNSVAILNRTKEDIPKGILQFVFNSKECNRVNNAIHEAFDAPFETVQNEKGIWIPFEFSMNLLNGSILPGEDVLLLSAPRQGILDLFHNIASRSHVFRFDYAKDLGFSEGKTAFLGSANHFVNVMNGLITFDGESWLTFLQSGNFINKYIGDLGYDVSYGSTLARLVCTNAADEAIDSAQDAKLLFDLLHEKGALGNILTDLKNSNQAEISDLLKQGQQALQKIKNKTGNVAEFNRIYDQLDRAMNKSVFIGVGDSIKEVQKSSGKMAVGIVLLSLAAQVSACYSEFSNADAFAVDSLEAFAKELPLLGGEVKISTRSALLEGAELHRKDLVTYSMTRLIEENLDVILSTGIDLCTKANIMLLAWDLASMFVPFISEGLKSADNYELSVYAICLQNEAQRIYQENMVALSAKGHLTEADQKLLAQYAYTYLKLCYISRNAASDGINVMKEEARIKLEEVKDDLKYTNSQIVPQLTLSKKSTSVGYCNGAEYLYGTDHSDLEDVLNDMFQAYQVLSGQPSGGNVPTPDAILSPESAVAIYMANKEVWMEEYDASWSNGYGYCLLDLDFDGVLELINSKNEGTGWFSYNNFYRINTDKQTVEEIQPELDQDYSGGIDYSFCLYGSKLLKNQSTGMLFYLFKNVCRVSVMEGDTAYSETYMQAGKLYENYIYSEYWHPDYENDTYEQVRDYTFRGESVTKLEYEQKIETFYEENVDMNLIWKCISGAEFDDSNDTERRQMLLDAYRKFSYNGFSFAENKRLSGVKVYDKTDGDFLYEQYSFAYDDNGRLVKIMQEDSRAGVSAEAKEMKIFSYDVNGYLIESVDYRYEDGYKIRYYYDNAGRLICFKEREDPHAAETRFVYNSDGTLAGISHEDGGYGFTKLFVYDQYGNLEKAGYYYGSSTIDYQFFYYDYYPFEVEQSVQDDRNWYYLYFKNPAGIELFRLTFSEPEYIMDESGYLTKVIDRQNADYGGHFEFEFIYETF